jgi:hypothetical protein
VQNNLPRKVKAKITRVVEEVALVELERDGTVREFIETHSELGTVDVLEVIDIIDVITVWD